jgi:hypothetical protein
MWTKDRLKALRDDSGWTQLDDEMSDAVVAHVNDLERDLAELPSAAWAEPAASFLPIQDDERASR